MGCLYLKSLEIQGFKSFPDKTKLVFDRGISAVVGPNGSGKSNISDAIRWVLGEQSTKTLRGAKMEDVIFAGTKTRKPLGFAEVSITLDNSRRTMPVDSDEVTITRKYYRSGESEYRINSTNVRLKDVRELLMDTGMGRDGYSIIGQGRIAEIVSAKSQERREIFEEAAGISKYRYRKEEAEKRLALAQENLLRLNDILSELEVRVGPLKEQSEKAKKYLLLAEGKKKLEISLWMHTLDSMKDQLKQQEDKIYIVKSQYDSIEETIESTEKEIERLYNETAQCSVLMEQLRTGGKQREEQSAKIDAEIAVLKNNIEHALQNIQRIQAAMEESKQQSAGENEEIAAKKQEIEQNIAAIAKSEQELSDLEQELKALSDRDSAFNEQTRSISSQISALTAETSDLKVTSVTSDTQIQQFEERIQALTVSAEQKRLQQDELKNEAAGLEDILSTLQEKKQEHENALKGFEYKQNQRTQKRDEVLIHLRRTESELSESLQRAKLLTDLDNSFEGFAYSVKHVLSEAKQGRLRGVLGPVSKLIQVDLKYTVAIEVALGGALQNIVVENEADAKSAIELLKQSGKGRATFLPVTSVKGSALESREFTQFDGFIDVASNLVSCDGKFEGISRSLLGRTLVAEDLDCGTMIAKKTGYRHRVVTLDGQLINAGGSFTGGSVNKTGGLLSRENEIEQLKQKAAVKQTEADKIKTELARFNSELEAIGADIQNIKSEMMVIHEDSIRFAAEQKRISSVLQDCVTQIAAYQKEAEELKEKMEALKEISLKSGEKLKNFTDQIAALEQQYAELTGSAEGMKRQREALSEAISERKLAKTALHGKNEALRASIAEIENRLAYVQNRADLLQKEMQETESQIQGHEEQIKLFEARKIELSQESADTEEKIRQANQRRMELEQAAVKLRSEVKGYTDSRESVSRELTRLEERRGSMQGECDALVARLWDEYELTRSEAAGVAEPLENKTAAEKQLGSLKGQIKALGSVNIDAIEEYAEVSQRYEFLKAQLDDVLKSKQELLKMIAELTNSMRCLFSESFEKINRNFTSIFKELFEGGNAYLTLTDSENVLESGIEIFVEPPGKIIKNLAALSGGEQAFVAIAIYFAILKVRPAPFCILDEIEAALDDVNVNKYAAYLRKMNDNTQFILITHRRGSMEESDVLYGVTMQEEGVSKMLELNVGELESKLNMK